MNSVARNGHIVNLIDSIGILRCSIVAMTGTILDSTAPASIVPNNTILGGTITTGTALVGIVPVGIVPVGTVPAAPSVQNGFHLCICNSPFISGGIWYTKRRIVNTKLLLV